jgi:hypothetical protein
MSACTWRGAAIVRLVSADTAHRCWWTGLGNGDLPVESGFGALTALRRGRIGLTIKPPIGYGSDVSASRPARPAGDETSTWG